MIQYLKWWIKISYFNVWIDILITNVAVLNELNIVYSGLTVVNIFFEKEFKNELFSLCIF